MKRRQGRPRVDPVIRFWAKVDKSDGCWLWTGTPNNDGYGRLSVGGRHVLAHRFSWELHGLGLLGDQGLDHKCLNRMCVNPWHLRVATQSQNNQNFAGAQRRNPTGARGVTRTRNGRPYKAQVVHEGTAHYLGRFDTLEAAAQAARDKRLELYTHNENDKKVKRLAA